MIISGEYGYYTIRLKFPEGFSSQFQANWAQLQGAVSYWNTWLRVYTMFMNEIKLLVYVQIDPAYDHNSYKFAWWGLLITRVYEPIGSQAANPKIIIYPKTDDVTHRARLNKPYFQKQYE